MKRGDEHLGQVVDKGHKARLGRGGQQFEGKPNPQQRVVTPASNHTSPLHPPAVLDLQELRWLPAGDANRVDGRKPSDADDGHRPKPQCLPGAGK
jgi:hypothetical protein